jgi:plastocyanin
VRRAVLAVALVAACSSGTEPREVTENGSVDATGPAHRQVVRIATDNSRVFLPNTVRALPGTLELTLDNRGALAHNLVFDDRDLGRTPTVDGRSSATLTVRLPGPGVYTFTCTLHPGQDGQVIVTGATA